MRLSLSTFRTANPYRSQRYQQGDQQDPHREDSGCYLHASAASAGTDAPVPLHGVLDQNTDVLDRTDQILLDGHSPEPSPSGLLKAKGHGPGKGSLHQVLSRPQVPSGGCATRLAMQGIQYLLSHVPGDGPSRLVAGTLGLPGTAAAMLRLGPVDDVIPGDGASPQGTLHRTAVGIGLGIVAELLFGQDIVSMGGSQRPHVGTNALVMAGEEVLGGPVLAVRDDRLSRDPCRLFVVLEQGKEAMGLVDHSGCYFHGGNHPVGGIDRPMRLVAEPGGSVRPDEGSIGIGRREVLPVDGGVWMRIEPACELLIHVDHRVFRGMGINEAAVRKNPGAVDEARLDTLGDDAFKERAEYLFSPSPSGFRQDTMIRDLRFDGIAQEPEPVEALRERLHQLPLGAYIVEHEQEHELQDHGGRDRDMAGCAVRLFDLLVDKIEVDLFLDPAEEMVLTDPVSS
jgi:hypothetical protein